MLLASQDAAENVWPIAAVCDPLGPSLARQVTFTTYSHWPGYSRYHLIGAVPETLPPDARTRASSCSISPPGGSSRGWCPSGGCPARGDRRHGRARAVAAGSGVRGSAESRASTAGCPRSPWPPGCSAGPWTPPRPNGVAGWLVTAGGALPEQLADVALGVTLDQPDGTLSSQRLLELLGLARRLAAADRVRRLELILAERALARLARGAARRCRYG